MRQIVCDKCGRVIVSSGANLNYGSSECFAREPETGVYKLTFSRDGCPGPTVELCAGCSKLVRDFISKEHREKQKNGRRKKNGDNGLQLLEVPDRETGQQIRAGQEIQAGADEGQGAAAQAVRGGA